MKIRKFRPGDEQELSVLIRRDLIEVNKDDPQWENDYLYAFYTPENVKKNSELGHTYVIENENKKSEFGNTFELIGTGTVKPGSCGSGEAEICGCFIKPEYIGRGAGKLLFDTLEKDEFVLNSKRAWLTTSVCASGFYEHRGYRYVYGYKGRNKDNLVEMEIRRV